MKIYPSYFSVFGFGPPGPFGNSGFETGARQNCVIQFRNPPFCQIWMQFGGAGFETGVAEWALSCLERTATVPESEKVFNK